VDPESSKVDVKLFGETFENLSLTQPYTSQLN